MKSKKIILFLALSFILSCSGDQHNFDASGTFETTEILVSSETQGKILQLDIEEGVSLEANQQIGLVDTFQLHLKKLQLIASKRAVNTRRPEVQKQIAILNQQIATQNNEKNRMENLVRANAASQKQLDDINAYISLLEKQLEAQKSTLKSTSNSISAEMGTIDIQIEQLNDQLNKSRIINPIKGTVLVKYTEANEITMPGKALYKIADLDKMILRAYITASQLSNIRIGQNVKVFIDKDKDSYKEYNGKIEWISSKSEFTPKTIQTKDERANLVYAIKIAVPNDGFIKIGMYGEVKFK